MLIIYSYLSNRDSLLLQILFQSSPADKNILQADTWILPSAPSLMPPVAWKMPSDTYHLASVMSLMPSEAWQLASDAWYLTPTAWLLTIASSPIAKVKWPMAFSRQFPAMSFWFPWTSGSRLPDGVLLCFVRTSVVLSAFWLNAMVLFFVVKIWWIFYFFRRGFLYFFRRVEVGRVVLVSWDWTKSRLCFTVLVWGWFSPNVFKETT